MTKLLAVKFPSSVTTDRCRDQYKSQIVDDHIKYISKQRKRNITKLELEQSSLRARLSLVKYTVLKVCMYKIVDSSLKQVVDTHNKKLTKLWVEKRWEAPEAIMN